MQKLKKNNNNNNYTKTATLSTLLNFGVGQSNKWSTCLQWDASAYLVISGSETTILGVLERAVKCLIPYLHVRFWNTSNTWNKTNGISIVAESNRLFQHAITEMILELSNFFLTWTSHTTIISEKVIISHNA